MDVIHIFKTRITNSKKNTKLHIKRKHKKKERKRTVVMQLCSPTIHWAVKCLTHRLWCCQNKPTQLKSKWHTNGQYAAKKPNWSQTVTINIHLQEWKLEGWSGAQKVILVSIQQNKGVKVGTTFFSWEILHLKFPRTIQHLCVCVSVPNTKGMC